MPSEFESRDVAQELARKAKARSLWQLFVYLVWFSAWMGMIRLHLDDRLVAATSVWVACAITVAPLVLGSGLLQWYFRRHPLP